MKVAHFRNPDLRIDVDAGLGMQTQGLSACFVREVSCDFVDRIAPIA